jgi:hypothetical protein
LSRAEPQSRREFTSSAAVGDLQTVGTSAGRSKPRLRRPDRWPHPKPLCASAALRETNNADPTTTRSKSRSPPNPDRSRRAAEPQRAQHKRGRWGLPGRWHRSGTLSPAPHHGDGWRHPRALGGLAAWRDKNDATTTARSKSRSPPNPDRSRRAAKPQRAQHKRGRWGPPDRRHRSGTPRGTTGLVALNHSAPLATRLLRPSESRQTPPTPTEPSVCPNSVPSAPLWFVRPTQRRALPPPLPAARPARPSPQLLVVATPPRGAPPPRLPFAARRAQHDAPHPGAAVSSAAIHAP